MLCCLNCFDVLTYAAETDLSKIIKDKSIVYTEDHVRSWMFQLLDGTRYLHENWVCPHLVAVFLMHYRSMVWFLLMV